MKRLLSCFIVLTFIFETTFMKNFSIILAFVICISSCKIQNPRFFNSPSTQSPAYIEKKGDSKISANLAILPEDEYPTFDSSFPLIPASNGYRKSRTYGFDASTAYAFSNRFMATFGATYQKERDIFSSNDILQKYSSSRIDYTRKALDVGIGAILPHKDFSAFVFNPIIGINFGRSESFFKNTSDTINDDRVFYFHGNFHKLYLKPNLNFHTGKNFKMSFVPQFSLMKYRNIDDNYTEEARELLGINRLRQDYLFLFEPATFYQIGFNKIDWLKLDLGIVLSLYLKGKDVSDRLRTRNLQLLAGFSIYP